jgi:hypothetical protein
VTDRRQWRFLLAAFAAASLALPASASAAKRSCRETAVPAKRCHARSIARVRGAELQLPRARVGSRGLEPTGRWAPFALD